MKALSIRQPWAWAIMMGKDIENRTWSAVKHGLDEKGRFAVHASKGMTQKEYEDVSFFLAGQRMICPPAADLERGGIIGTVELVEVVRKSDSPWFFGPCGLVLRNPEPCEFLPCKGQLGFFEWEYDESAKDEPKPWMIKQKQSEIDSGLDPSNAMTLSDYGNW